MKYNEIANFEVNLGDKVYFKDEKRPYKVVALNEKLFMLQKAMFGEVCYTIICPEQGICGPDNSLFGYINYKDRKECQELIDEMAGIKKPKDYLSDKELKELNLKSRPIYRRSEISHRKGMHFRPNGFLNKKGDGFLLIQETENKKRPNYKPYKYKEEK